MSYDPLKGLVLTFWKTNLFPKNLMLLDYEALLF